MGNIVSKYPTGKLKRNNVENTNKQNRNEESHNEESRNGESHNEESTRNEEQTDNDSRWTLKYREPAPGLVELIKNSGVYVNAHNLELCKKLYSNSSNRLARILLTEVFTKRALSTCSWAKTSSINGGHARPGLDEHARNTLLMFIEEYGLIRNWNITDYQYLLKSMRQIMLDMRRTFFLPPEYDEKDPRWTLKYREPALGLVELIERSRIYVNADKLDECKRLSGDSRTLAVLLLTEIFTETALSTCVWCDISPKPYNRFDSILSECSLSDMNPNAFYREDLLFRPNLDEHAKEVLLKFVLKHKKEQYHIIIRPSVYYIEAGIILKMKEMRDRPKYNYD